MANASINFENSAYFSGLSADGTSLDLDGLTITASGGVITQFLGLSVASPGDPAMGAWTQEIDAYNDHPESIHLAFDKPQSTVTITLAQTYAEQLFLPTPTQEITDVTIHFSDGSTATTTILGSALNFPGEATFTLNSSAYGGRMITSVDLAPDLSSPPLPAGYVPDPNAPITTSDYNAQHPFSEFTLKSVSFTNNNCPVTITCSDASGSVCERSGVTGSTALDKDTGYINFTDGNKTDKHTASVQAVGATLGTLTLGAVSEKNGNGSVGWTYAAVDGALDYLAAGQTKVESFKVTVDDGHGGTDTQIVKITITGSNDNPLFDTAHSNVVGSVTELANTTGSSALDTTNGILAFKDVDLTDTHSMTVTPVGTTLGTLTLGTITEGAGAGTVGWVYKVTDGKLDYLAAGQTKTEVFTVKVNDGHGGTATQTVTITLNGADEGAGTPPPHGFNHPPTAFNDLFSVNASASTGNIWSPVLANDTDPDVGDTKAIVSVDTSATNGIVLLNTTTQSLTYIADSDAYASVAKGSSGVDSFGYTMADSGGLTSSAIVHLTVNGVGNTLTGGSGCDSLCVTGPNAVVDGKGGNDFINGSSYADVLKGGDGDDCLSGNGGADVLYGQKGDDYIDGGAGDDVIIGGAGKNWLTGGSGSDTFVMSILTEKDTILDFKVGTDHLYFENGLTVTNVAQQNILFTQSTVLTLSDGSTVALVGVTGVGDWHTLM